VGERGTLSKNDRKEHKNGRVVRARLEREGSKETIVLDVEALEKTISDLRSLLDCAVQTIVAKDNDLE